VTKTGSEVCVEVVSADAELELPESLVGTEFAFLVGLLRKATREKIRPVRATAKQEIRNHAYAEFMGVGITPAEKNQLVFSRTELLPPFISCNESIWEFFEPKPNKRLIGKRKVQELRTYDIEKFYATLPRPPAGSMCTV